MSHFSSKHHPIVSPSTLSDASLDKKAIRTIIRKQRRSLSQSQQIKASKNFAKEITRSRLLVKHQHIALYLGNDGELNPEILINTIWKKKKHAYLPVIHPFKQNTLCFCRVDARTKFKKNKFGILEPDFRHSTRMSNHFLSLVLLPLVAFDKAGNRMGMGGGFYDRCFAFKSKTKARKPKLIGVAHAFQEHEYLPVEKWDIPIEGVITDKSIIHF